MTTPMKLMCAVMATAISVVVIDAFVGRHESRQARGPAAAAATIPRPSPTSPDQAAPEPPDVDSRTSAESRRAGAILTVERRRVAWRELGRMADERDAAHRELLAREREGFPARVDAAHAAYRAATRRFEATRRELLGVR